MFENIINFFKKKNKEDKKTANSKSAAKERLHLVLMQDRANVSADFLELMKQEIIEVIKKYIEVDEEAIDVRLTNQTKDDGTNGAPALYANIPIMNIKNENKKSSEKEDSKEDSKEKDSKEEKKEEIKKDDKSSSKKVENKESTKKEEKEEIKNTEKKEEKEENKDTDKKEEKNNKTKKADKKEVQEDKKSKKEVEVKN